MSIPYIPPAPMDEAHIRAKQREVAAEYADLRRDRFYSGLVQPDDSHRTHTKEPRILGKFYDAPSMLIVYSILLALSLGSLCFFAFQPKYLPGAILSGFLSLLMIYLIILNISSYTEIREEYIVFSSPSTGKTRINYRDISHWAYDTEDLILVDSSSPKEHRIYVNVTRVNCRWVIAQILYREMFSRSPESPDDPRLQELLIQPAEWWWLLDAQRALQVHRDVVMRVQIAREVRAELRPSLSTPPVIMTDTVYVSVNHPALFNSYIPQAVEEQNRQVRWSDEPIFWLANRADRLATSLGYDPNTPRTDYGFDHSFNHSFEDNAGSGHDSDFSGGGSGSGSGDGGSF